MSWNSSVVIVLTQWIDFSKSSRHFLSYICTKASVLKRNVQKKRRIQMETIVAAERVIDWGGWQSCTIHSTCELWDRTEYCPSNSYSTRKRPRKRTLLDELGCDTFLSSCATNLPVRLAHKRKLTLQKRIFWKLKDGYELELCWCWIYQFVSLLKICDMNQTEVLLNHRVQRVF